MLLTETEPKETETISKPLAALEVIKELKLVQMMSAGIFILFFISAVVNSIYMLGIGFIACAGIYFYSFNKEKQLRKKYGV